MATEPYLPPSELWPDRLYTLPELQYPDTLNVASELLDRHVDAGAEASTAIVFAGQRTSFAELQRQVNQIGNGLASLGLEPGDRVIMRFPNRPICVATWLAIQKIGAVGVATMPMLRSREIGYVANDSEAKAIVVAADLIGEVDKAAPAFAKPPIIVTAGPVVERLDHLQSIVSLESLMANAPPTLTAHATGKDDVALIAYTSGSTGPPKGTCHAPSDMLASADAYARHILSPDASDVFGGHPSIAFTFGLGGLLVFPFRFGASSALLEAFTPERMLETVATARITILFCAATTYRLLLQVPDFEHRFDLSSLRLCVSAGEPLPAPVCDEWMRRTRVDILDGLGSTEMFQIFVSARPGDVRPGATGLAVPGYDVKVVNEHLDEVPRGTQGLIAVRGPSGCRYWRKPDRQRDYVRNGWNIPNDVYIQDDEGYFWYQCRNDDLIISAGYNIAGPEVEAVLLEHAAVLEAAVVASPDPVRGFVPKAFVVLKPGQVGSDELTAALQEHAKRELAPYKYPREVEYIAALPKTETGKIRRVELREREKARKVSALS